MLPTYPKLERYRDRRNRDAIRSRIRSLAPMLGMVRSHVQFEGRGSAIQRESGELDPTRMNRSSADVTLRITELTEFTEAVIDGYIQDVSEQMARSMSEHLFETVNESAAKVGNVINAEGKPFGENIFLDMIERMEHRFARDGTWQPPTIVTGPELAEKLAALGEMSDAGNARLKGILERKLDDFRRREAARVLAG